MARRLARLALTVLLIGSFALTVWSAWTLWRSPAAAFLTARSEAAVAARLERLLAEEATAPAVSIRLDALVGATPRDWARIEALETLAEQQGVTLDPGLASRLDAAREEDHGVVARSGACLRCAWNIENCDLTLVMICRAPIELTVLGDVSTLIGESANYVAGEPVDDVPLALAAIGLGATALVPLTGGSSMTLKAGAGLAKIAHRLGALPAPLLDAGRAIAREGFDWSVIAKARPTTFLSDLERGVRPEVVKPAVEFAAAVGEMRQAAGTTGALMLLRRVESVDEARRMAAAARALKSRTAGAVEVLGKNRVLRATLRFADEVYALIVGALVLIGSLVGFFVGLLKTLLLRWLRRRVRG